MTASIAALVAMGGVTTYVAPDVAVSETLIAAPAAAKSGSVGPRIELAQASPSPLPASTLPGGASSLNETYKDWQVSCVQQGNTRRCVIHQQQMSQQTRQRVLAVEINLTANNRVDGILVLPFGLSLDVGAKLQIDDSAIGQPLRFRTCLPAGCVVPLSFDSGMVAALRRGTVLKVLATADGGAVSPFSVSLQGFGTALDRIIALAR